MIRSNSMEEINPPEDATSDAGALEVADVWKRFGGVNALRGVDTVFRAGKVHALLGENGAGKSTLVGVCSGAVIPDRGTLRLNGSEAAFSSPFVAARAGVVVVHQEPALAPQLTVLENIFLPRLSRNSPLSRFRLKDLEGEAEQLLARLGLQLDLRRRVQSLPIAGRQLVEIAKAVAMSPQVLILDEPNSALSPAETERMLDLMRRLRDDGRALVFVTHRLPEVFAICDEATVLRDGEVVWKGNIGDTSIADVVARMAGTDTLTSSPAAPRTPTTRLISTEPVLETVGLTRAREFEDVSLTLHKGEILGLAGLVGSGRSELAACLFGVTRPEAGSILVHNAPITFASPKSAMRAGISLVPEDRRVQSLFSQMSVQWNIEVASTSLRRRVRGVAQRLIRDFRIKTASPEIGVTTLSGGNQQKSILARWVALNPKVLILDEPTRGVDVGAKREIYDLVRRFASEGMSLIVISSEFEEVLDIADRVLVMRHGRIVREFGHDPDAVEVMAAAFGEGDAA